MKIANPLYDKAFKYLMQNERIAKKVLTIILDQEIHDLQLRPQETTYADDEKRLNYFRLDFKAIISDENGEKKKVLIELQKSKLVTDMIRFRRYLGANYMKADLQVEDAKVAYAEVYPIITVYILGYNLEEIPYLAVNVNHQVIDAVSKQPVEVKSDFIDHLNHRSHILQVRRLPEERKTRLEKFMLFFNQAWCIEEKFIIDLKEDEILPEFADIAKHLREPLMDEELRRQLELEEEFDFNWIYKEQQEARYRELLVEKAKVEKEKTEVEKKKAEAEKEKAKAEKVRAKAEKERAEAEKERAEAEKKKTEAERKKTEAEKEKIEAEKSLHILIKILANSGKSVEEIALLINKPVEWVKKIITE
ncbi:MAG: hypothetical protein ACOCXH_01010 [Cyclobacteriaceae bacterium]